MAGAGAEECSANGTWWKVRMSRKHQEYSGLATAIGQMAGFFLIGCLGLVVLSLIIEGIRYLFTLI